MRDWYYIATALYFFAVGIFVLVAGVFWIFS